MFCISSSLSIRQIIALLCMTMDVNVSEKVEIFSFSRRVWAWKMKSEGLFVNYDMVSDGIMWSF